MHPGNTIWLYKGEGVEMKMMKLAEILENLHLHPQTIIFLILGWSAVVVWLILFGIDGLPPGLMTVFMAGQMEKCLYPEISDRSDSEMK